MDELYLRVGVEIHTAVGGVRATVLLLGPYTEEMLPSKPVAVKEFVGPDKAAVLTACSDWLAKLGLHQ